MNGEYLSDAMGTEMAFQEIEVGEGQSLYSYTANGGKPA